MELNVFFLIYLNDNSILFSQRQVGQKTVTVEIGGDTVNEDFNAPDDGIEVDLTEVPETIQDKVIDTISRGDRTTVTVFYVSNDETYYYITPEDKIFKSLCPPPDGVAGTRTFTFLPLRNPPPPPPPKKSKSRKSLKKSKKE